MALTFQQQRWVQSHSAEEIASYVSAGRIDIEQLKLFAAQNATFASKFNEIQSLLTTMPSAEENAEFEALKNIYTNDPAGSLTYERINRYLAEWEGNGTAAEHVAKAKLWRDRIREIRLYERLEMAVPRALDEYDRNGIIPDSDLMEALKEYVRDFVSTEAGAEHANQCTLWSQRFDDIEAEELSRDWEAVLTEDGNLASPDALKAFLQKHGSNLQYRDMADDILWEWALKQNDINSGIRTYNSIIRTGKHTLEAANVARLKLEWDNVDHSDIFEVIAFREKYPDSLLDYHVGEKLEQLKQAELNKMSADPGVYNSRKFARLYNSGACSRQELMEANNADEEAFERIMNLPQIVADEITTVPPPKADMIDPKGVGNTDIVLFGIPSSGKTCVLTGILSSDRLDVDTSDWSGSYAASLRTFGRARVAPPATQTELASMIRSQIYSYKGNKQIKTPFNLVDMAGETFRQKIVQINTGNADSTVSFADMGSGAPEILANDNDKVFFIIVDPTAAGRRKNLQDTAIQKLLNIFYQPENNRVMNHVRGIHFIVTKADTLGERRLPAAQRYLRSILNEGARTTLVNYCRDHGINAASDRNLNGTPRIFCFSLGIFHAGNTFTPKGDDAEVLLNVISDYVVYDVKPGLFDKMRTQLTTPRF